MCTASFFSGLSIDVPIENFPINQDLASIISCPLPLAIPPFYDLTRRLLRTDYDLLPEKSIATLSHTSSQILFVGIATCFELLTND
jgi:hypothetical protein